MSSHANPIVSLTLCESSSQVFDFRELWPEVEEICGALLRIVQDGSMKSSNDFARQICTARTLVHHLVSHPCSNYPTSDEFNGQGNAQQVRAVFVKLKEFLERWLKGNVAVRFQKKPSTKMYVCLWREFLVVVANLKTIFSPLTFTSPASGFEENLFDGAEDVAFELWKQSMLAVRNRETLQGEFSRIVSTERENDVTDASSHAAEFKDSLTMLAEPDIYRTIIESTYREDLLSHYNSKLVLEMRQGTCSCVSYASACCEWIAKETLLSSKYLQSKDALLNELVTVLVKGFKTRKLTDELVGVMKIDDPKSCEQMRIVYTFLSQDRAVGSVLLEDAVKAFSNRETMNTLKRQSPSLTPGSRSDFLVGLSNIISQLALFFNTAFPGDDGGLVEAMESGISDAVAQFAGPLSFRTTATELVNELARLASDTLTPEHVNKRLSIEDIVSIYYFLPDEPLPTKDLFLTAYHRFLAVRLLGGGYSRESEHHALDLLTVVRPSPRLFCCGRMFRMVATRSIYNQITYDEQLGASVNPIIVPKGMWPSSQARNVAVPQRIGGAVSRAAARYGDKYPGRTLSLDPMLSMCVVRFHLPGRSGESVLLELSLVQFCIVKLFNTPHAPMTVTSIAQELDISEDLCRAALEPLAREGIIKCGDKSVELGSPSKDYGDTQVNLLPNANANASASANANANLVASPTSVGTPTEVRKTQQTTSLKAVIVSFLKNNGPQTWNAILKHLSSLPRGTPYHEDVKKSLDGLIESQIVVREDEDIFRFVC